MFARKELETPPGNGFEPTITVLNGGMLESPQYPHTRADWASFPVKIKRNCLWVGGFEVMGAWEKPPAERTMRELFYRTPVDRPTVLIGGEGMGFSTQTALAEARNRVGGAVIHVVELHPEIMEQGKTRAELILKRMTPQERAKIEIHWHLADIQNALKTFLNDSFDLVMLDTYPLSADEKKLNDSRHTPEVVRIIKPGGLFAPYIGEVERPTDEQLRQIEAGFNNREFIDLAVSPPKRSWFTGERMVIGIWKNPRKTVFQRNVNGFSSTGK